MSNSNYDMNPVKDLVKVLNGGAEFYAKAKEKLDNPMLERIFEQNILEKTRAASALQPFIVTDEGKVEEDSAFSVELRETYTQIISLVSTDKEHTYISQLEEVEDKVLEKIDSALKQPLPPACYQSLSQTRLNMKACHDEMKHLKEVSA
jgi:uncharacterized protein (TIGR02284 family)